jgi:16S rRNA G527 N7-methylase RsmG
LAISLSEKKFILVETIHKKSIFLNEAIHLLKLENATVWEGPVQEFVRHHGRFESTIISRGFPKIDILADYVYNKKVKELVLISSKDKIIKIKNHVANIRQNHYNIPSRDNLIIIKLENVSRETR